MPSSMERMKHLLSSGDHSDVHFVVGDGEAKEILPSHQLILKNASDVFEAMFHFDAKKEQGEKAFANCPAVVEVPDVEASAFKLMLSFIYADDLSELNGDNAMAVLYAAKKFNIPDLVDESLQIPISELRNVFLAYAQALLFELEDFANKCLRYICQNASQLFESNDFLKIDQNVLCNLLNSDRLLISDEFEIWKAAFHWAHEKCRQNGIECSAKNCRAVLGPALFKIRFPNIDEEDFSKCVVPSGVLTMEEVLGIYQFFCHPTVRGVPGLYSLKFPSHGRISDWNKVKGNSRWTLALEIEKLSEFAREEVGSSRDSENEYIKGLTWKIQAEISVKWEGTDAKKYLGFYLWCCAKEEGPSNCVLSLTYRIVSEKNEADNSIGTLCDCALYSLYEFENFITFSELMDTNNGFYNKEEDKVTLAIDVTVKEMKTKKFVSNPDKCNGTISMEIENLSEFAREIIGSERKSDIVHIKGFPWKIWAKIETENGSTNNEKWLGFYLCCDAPEEDENLGCQCSAIFRIVAQNSDLADIRRELYDQVFDNTKNSCLGYSNFISFAGLMVPEKGIYEKSEDKVKLAIDFIVKEAKAEDKSK
ncbi:hypothetical protein niasHT_006163 [Heterodera trifolii]|uniref:BTB domain-containing protein n=1 Tax=Heterodera trifolii TaxID=157864 RepID=A0ABD2M2B5_9BILA